MIGKILKEKPSGQALWLSVSKIKTFQQCKAKYRFEYVDRIKKTKVWDHLDFGNCLHSALENFHKKIIEGDNRAENELMTISFKESLQQFSAKLSAEQKNEAFKMLSLYLKIYNDLKLNSKLPKVLSVESSFYIDIDGIIFNGKIDKIQIDHDGLINICDYKTTKNKSFLKKDKFQLMSYAYVKFLEDPQVQKLRTSYVLLKHNFENILEEYCREDVSSFESSIIEIRDSLDKEKLWRPETSRLCEYCDFLDICEEGKRATGKFVEEIGKSDW